jgi:NAD(P)-dependent dehydrogenase (short-subunit alcohol dehydrogenase family)
MTFAHAIYPDLAGKRVLVTGGAEGIGQAIAVAFLAQGASVAILDIDAVRLAALCSEHASLHTQVVDLRDVAATRAAVAKLMAGLGGFDILVNNAGHDERHAFADLTPDAWDERMAVNLRHVMFVTQAVAPAMRAAGGGAVINLGSTSWMKGAPGLIAYTTAKAAILGFTRSLARELGPDNIRVNAIAPGWVMTKRQRSRWATPEKIAAAMAQQALKREILPEDVAAAALYLASETARSVTGQTLVVDAGSV